MGLRSWLGGGDRRRTGLPETTAPAADAPGTGGGPSGAWRDLPPLQRTTDDLGLLTDPGGFRASLDTWQDVSLSRPPGHLVSPEAPTGLVYGIASPAEAAAPGHETGQAPPFDPAPRDVGPASRTTDASRTAVAVQRTPDTAALTSAVGTGTGPFRQVTGLPFRAEPAPASAAEAPPAVRDMPLVPPAPVQRTAEPPRTPHHHLGVGEPLAHLPFTAQREPAGRSVPAPVRPGATELPLPSGPFDSGATPAAPGGPVAPTNPLLGDDPLVPAEAQAPQADVPAPEFRSQPSSPPETADPVRPLPVVGVQRLPSAVDKAPTTAEEPERTTGLTGERPLPLFTETARAEAPDPGPTVVVARWAAGAQAPGPSGTSGPAPGSPAPGTPATPQTAPAPVPVVVPSVQRAPVPPSGSGPRRPAATPVNSPWTDAGSAAVAAGVAQRAVDNSVVFGPRSPRPAATNPVPVQRATDPAPLPEPGPAPVPDPPSVPATDPAASASAPPSSGHSTAPAAPQDAGSAHSVDDELVRALFPRLSRLLKAELRLDRERAGFLITTRH